MVLLSHSSNLHEPGGPFEGLEVGDAQLRMKLFDPLQLGDSHVQASGSQLHQSLFYLRVEGALLNLGQVLG